MSICGFKITIQFNVASESHPETILWRTAVWRPASSIERPFQLKGSSDAQTVVSVSLVKVGLINRLRLTIESQPVMILSMVVV